MPRPTVAHHPCPRPLVGTTTADRVPSPYPNLCARAIFPHVASPRHGCTVMFPSPHRICHRSTVLHPLATLDLEPPLSASLSPTLFPPSDLCRHPSVSFPRTTISFQNRPPRGFRKSLADYPMETWERTGVAAFFVRLLPASLSPLPPILITFVAISPSVSRALELGHQALAMTCLITRCAPRASPLARPLRRRPLPPVTCHAP
jgi:hypothetical protein